nr:putative ribonuclease H-like domain-containing protein [Tanacetum cinerariifolium]
MRIDELHKFNDGTLNDVRNALDDRLKGIWMQYLPTTIWRKRDKDRAAAIIQAIDKMLKTRRIIRSLERYEKKEKSEKLGRVPTEMELILEHTQQGISYEVSMEILLESTSNKLMVESLLYAGNPVKEILLKVESIRSQVNPYGFAGKWRYLIPAEPPIHNHMLTPNYQDFKIQDFRYSDGFECFQAIKIGRTIIDEPKMILHNWYKEPGAPDRRVSAAKVDILMLLGFEHTARGYFCCSNNISAASDYAGASLDRNSTTEGCQFLGRRLISWKCKKKTIVTNSTIEV